MPTSALPEEADIADVPVGAPLGVGISASALGADIVHPTRWTTSRRRTKALEGTEVYVDAVQMLVRAIIQLRDWPSPLQGRHLGRSGYPGAAQIPR